MNFERLTEVTLYYQIGFVTVLASILTLIFTQIFKIILYKKKLLQFNETTKDRKLSVLGRTIGLVSYSIVYLVTEFYLHHHIIIDGAFLTAIFTGTTLTLNIAKGIYSFLHQKTKKEEHNTQKWIISQKAKEK